MNKNPIERIRGAVQRIFESARTVPGQAQCGWCGEDLRDCACGVRDSIMEVICPWCFGLRENCRCGSVLLTGQTDPARDGVYQEVPLGRKSPTVGNRHERRKRAAMARRRGG